ncbi:MAG: hypothetical protein ACFCUX_07950 [Candidatus Methylacidiphilales bacterium]
MKSIPALSRLLDLEEVAAVFTYKSDLKVEAAAVPPHYTEPLVEQLILRIDQVMSLTRKAHVGFKEAIFSFDGYALWVKSFGSDGFLALFLMPDANLSLLRQPINLAVVNLDSASQRRLDIETSTGNTELLNAAYRAEMELLQSDRPEVNDEKFLKLCALSEFFIGPVAAEILEYGLRDQKVELPFSNRSEMIRIVDFASKLISNVDHKKMYLDECAELIERMEIDLPVETHQAATAG